MFPLTLVIWLATAIGGFVLLMIWVQHGGMNENINRRFAKPLPLLHGGSAVISLILFLAYWIADIEALREVVLAGLLITALLGFAMFAKWITRDDEQAASADDLTNGSAPEDNFSGALVALHGIAAVATLVLYVAAAYIVI